MSALYPDIAPYEGSPFRKLRNKTNGIGTPRAKPNRLQMSTSSSSRLNLSPSKQPSFSHFTPSGHKSPFSKRSSGLAATKESQFMSSDSLASNLSTNTTSTMIRHYPPTQTQSKSRMQSQSQSQSQSFSQSQSQTQTHSDIHPRSSRRPAAALPSRSPVKLRATTNRLARQASDIIDTLDSQLEDPISFSRSELTESKRPLAVRSPPKLHHPSLSSSSSSSSSESSNYSFQDNAKRRKVVKFEEDGHGHDHTCIPDNELREVVLSLQEQVVHMQQEHNNAIGELRKMVVEQSRLISELLNRK